MAVRSKVAGWLGVLALASASWSAAARESVWKPAEDHALWRAECGACHVAFPPALLSPTEWRGITSRLDKHFGTDVGLDSVTAQEIAAYLERNAAKNPVFASADELPRITGSERFGDKHRGAFRLWRSGKIKTLTDCSACHKADETDN
jgi:mono/diheme cytochrome c family protein